MHDRESASTRGEDIWVFVQNWEIEIEGLEYCAFNDVL